MFNGLLGSGPTNGSNISKSTILTIKKISDISLFSSVTGDAKILNLFFLLLYSTSSLCLSQHCDRHKLVAGIPYAIAQLINPPVL